MRNGRRMVFVGAGRPLECWEGEVADLSRLDKAELKPFTALPKSLQAKLKGRPKAAVTKASARARPAMMMFVGVIGRSGTWPAVQGFAPTRQRRLCFQGLSSQTRR